MNWYFVFFFISGFCSVLYEVVWLRLAMAQFGVTTPMVSIVLSAFMGGLGLGSWGSGYLIRRYGTRIKFPALRFYALTELLISISAIAVPYQLSLEKQFLQRTLGLEFLSPAANYLFAGSWLTITFVPWCACMGATFPLAMLAIQNSFGAESKRSFSFLYLANVIGAVAGTTVPLLLIEQYGFRHTLYTGMLSNLLLAACAFGLTLRMIPVAKGPFQVEQQQSVRKEKAKADRRLPWVLFGTGLTSMGVEVVWFRLYTPSLGTFVYAFAAILALYLVCTYAGSWVYRRDRLTGVLDRALLWAALGLSVLFPLLTVDPRLPLPGLLRVLLGVAPLSSLVGFITPMVMDQYAWGDPALAGRGYAINIFGCVLGPLLSGFLLLPLVGERSALCVFALPWVTAGAASVGFAWRRRTELAIYSLFVSTTVALVVFTKAFEDQFAPRIVLRDSTATVIATGSGHGKRLLINGIGITSLTPTTKIMTHLPLAFLSHQPSSALIICFGMGTSHRSALSWHVNTTSVELVPSVPNLFSFFHPGEPSGLDSPLSHIVRDDGRSYMEQSQQQFDIVVIDPPPPVAAAASSLLYSKEFYAIARRRLRPAGILQQWLPGGDASTKASVVRALMESFPYVRAFRDPTEGDGFHLLASESPIAQSTASQLAKRLPPDAARDLIEWGPAATAEVQFQFVLDLELPPAKIVQDNPNAPALQDDRPVNEYFLIRRLGEPGYLRKVPQRLADWGRPSR